MSYFKDKKITTCDECLSSIPADEFRQLRRCPLDERKTGRWDYCEEAVFGNPYGSYNCSVCGNIEPHKTNFCPNCGTKMQR